MKQREFYEGSGKRLAVLRMQMDLSRKEMANRLGLSWPAYYKNETGETFPRSGTIKKLEKEFDISMDWLIFGKGPMYYKKETQRVLEMEKELERLKEKTEQLETESGHLKKELADEKALAKELADKSAGLDLQPEVRELVEHMERISLLYHEVMVHFHRFKMDNRELVEASMK